MKLGEIWQMKLYQKNYEIKNKAKDMLEGKYGGAVLLLFLSTLISGAVQLFINQIGSGTMGSVYAMTGSEGTATAISILFNILLLLASIVLGVMNAGIALYFLNIACGQSFSLKNLFYGFQTDSRRCLGIAAVIVTWRTLCLWPGQYLAQKYLNTLDGKWIPYALIALIVGMIVYVPVALGMELSFYLMLDFPQNSAKETLSLCWRIMKGNRKRLFLLELSFLPLMLLCALSFGIGFLWLNPYMQMTYTCFFLDLMNPKEKPV